jgi:alpha-galactosidase
VSGTLPSSPPEFVALHGRDSSLVLECHVDEAPIWRYWGPRLPDGASPGHALRDGRPLPSFMLDFDQPLTVLPTFGVGWFGQSALLAHRDGRDFAQAITRCEIEWLEPGRALRLTLSDAVASLRLDVTLKLDAASDVLLIDTALTNLGSGVLDVQWLAAGTLPLPGHAVAVRSYAGQHNHEFVLQTDKLSRSLWRRENRRGHTSHDCFPGAVVTTTEPGLAYSAQLAWSGNHQQTIEWLHDGQYQWQLGEWLAPGEGRLAPGQTLQSPQIVATCSTAGLDGIAANFHAELRARVPWPGGAMRPRPVHLNTWEAFYFNVRDDNAAALADAAADIGVERFVLDDGWFQGRHHDRAALGDWWVDAGKFPHGLGPLARHVNARGMEFGLWVEPEMINPDSELYRAHPDWALQIDGRPKLTARHQLVLDIARPDAAEYVFTKLDALLRELPIAYLKWDYNRDITTAALDGGRGGPAYRAQVLALYALLARLRAAHPQVEIESCSGGGGRIDFGILRHTHRVWTSDCIDALSRVDIQRGLLQFFPPEIMGAHIGTAPSHTTGRSHSMAFRAAVALPGHLGVELDARSLDGATREQLAQWIARYKALRGEIHGRRMWQGEADDGLVWLAFGEAPAADRGIDSLLLFVYRVKPTTHRYTPPLRLTMLAADARYRAEQVVTIDGEGAAQGRAPLWDALRDGSALFDGAWLARAGLPMPRSTAETCLIVRLVRLVRLPHAALQGASS